MDENYLKSLIKRLINKKKEKNITPLAITEAELYDSIMGDVRSSLNKLFIEKEITVYKTVSAKMIKLNNE